MRHTTGTTNSGPDFYKGIRDPEIKMLSALLASRLASPCEAMDKSDMLRELKEAMRDDIVHFIYDKSSGEQRSAYGTRSPDIISVYGGDPKGEGPSGPLKTFRYFDLMRRAWRSFRPENLISIDKENYTI